MQLGVYLGFELPREQQVSADLVQIVKSVHRLLNTGVEVHDASGDGVVCHLGICTEADQVLEQGWPINCSKGSREKPELCWRDESTIFIFSHCKTQ